MKVLIMPDGTTATMIQGGTEWTSADPALAKALNLIDRRLSLSGLSPQDGDPRGLIFDEAKKLFPDAQTIDTDPTEQEPKDIRT